MSNHTTIDKIDHENIRQKWCSSLSDIKVKVLNALIHLLESKHQQNNELKIWYIVLDIYWE